MELKLLAKDIYRVAAVTAKGKCPAEDFLLNLDATYRASTDGLFELLDRISQDGLDDISSALSREVDKNEKIYEFRKGKLRLFFFKGNGDLLVICTTGLIKKTQKVDKQAVAKAIVCKNQYLNAVKQNTLVILEIE